LAFLQKRTEEEKAADRAAKEQVKAQRAEAQESGRARQRAEAQRERAAYGSFVETLPKWEYRVLTNTALAGWGGGKVVGLEPLLNSVAAEGWRVLSISFTGQIDQFLATDKNHLYIVLERPARGDGHAGPPVAKLSG
jgi:hypothetical protein